MSIVKSCDIWDTWTGLAIARCHSIRMPHTCCRIDVCRTHRYRHPQHNQDTTCVRMSYTPDVPLRRDSADTRHLRSRRTRARARVRIAHNSRPGPDTRNTSWGIGPAYSPRSIAIYHRQNKRRTLALEGMATT